MNTKPSPAYNVYGGGVVECFLVTGADFVAEWPAPNLAIYRDRNTGYVVGWRVEGLPDTSETEARIKEELEAHIKKGFIVEYGGSHIWRRSCEFDGIYPSVADATKVMKFSGVSDDGIQRLYRVVPYREEGRP